MTKAAQTSIKRRLAAGETLIGCLLAFDAPWLVEMIGRSGFDFVTIDIEHEAFDEDAVVNLIRTAEGAGLASIVRMALSDRLLPYLDAGVDGVKVPDLRDRRHAEELVALTHFHPVGRRTYYTMGRAAHYGIGIDDHDWMERANEDMFVMAMIEDIHVVDHLDDILQVGEVDAFHVGPHDLAQSMGFPSPADLDDVIKRVIRKCREAGKHTSVGVGTPWNLEKVDSWRREGCQILTVGSSWVVSHAMVEMHNNLRSMIPADQQSRAEPTAVSRSSYLTGASKK